MSVTTDTKKDAYARKVEGKIEEWEAEIAKLKAKIKQASGTAEVEAREELAKAEARTDDMKSRLRRFKDRSEAAWDDIEDSFEEGWEKIEAGFKKAWARFD